MAVTPIPELDRTSPGFKAQVDEFFGIRIPRLVPELNVLQQDVAQKHGQTVSAANTALQSKEAAAASAAVSAERAAVAVASTSQTEAARNTALEALQDVESIANKFGDVDSAVELTIGQATIATTKAGEASTKAASADAAATRAEQAKDAAGVLTSFYKSFLTKPDMDADRNVGAGRTAIVIEGGPTWYYKIGASGTGSWEPFPNQPLSQTDLTPMRRTADRLGWNVVGTLTKAEPAQNSSDYLISFNTLTITGGTAFASSKTVAPVADLLVPVGQAAYVDLDGALDGSGRLSAQVTTGGYTAGMSTGAFVTDRRVYLFINGTGSQLGGPLAQQSLIGPAQLSVAAINRSVRPSFTLIGNVEDVRRLGTAAQVTTGVVSLARGAGLPVLRINAISKTLVPAGQALYVDLDGAVDSGGRLTAKVTTAGYASVSADTPAGSFVDDRRLYLFINDGTSNFSGPLAIASAQRRILNPVWLESGTPGSVTFDPVTRTLAWTSTLVLPLGGSGRRVSISPGSITIPSGNFQTVYLDMAEASTASGTTTPVSALKVAQYFDSNDVGRALGQDGSLPLFLYQSPTSWGPVNGFPKVRDATPETPLLLESDIIVRVSANAASIFVKGSKSASNRYIEYTLVHQVDAFNPDNLYGNRDVWRMGAAYECTRDSGAITFTRGRTILTGGEVECAILEHGAPDYIGGWHGDEVLSSFSLFLDGAPVDPATPAVLVGKSLRYMQAATLYRCNTQTPIAMHSKDVEISWSPSGSRIQMRQQVRWDAVVEVRAAMLTMLPIKRREGDTAGAVVTDRAMRAPLWEIEDVSEAGFTEVMSTGVLPDSQVWGSTSGVSAGARILRDPGIASRNFYVSNSVYYNKLYYSVAGRVNGVANHTVSPGEVWDVESEVTVNTSL